MSAEQPAPPAPNPSTQPNLPPQSLIPQQSIDERQQTKQQLTSTTKILLKLLGGSLLATVPLIALSLSAGPAGLGVAMIAAFLLYLAITINIILMAVIIASMIRRKRSHQTQLKAEWLIFTVGFILPLLLILGSFTKDAVLYNADAKSKEAINFELYVPNQTEGGMRIKSVEPGRSSYAGSGSLYYAIEFVLEDTSNDHKLIRVRESSLTNYREIRAEQKALSEEKAKAGSRYGDIRAVDWARDYTCFGADGSIINNCELIGETPGGRKVYNDDNDDAISLISSSTILKVDIDAYKTHQEVSHAAIDSFRPAQNKHVFYYESWWGRQLARYF